MPGKGTVVQEAEEGADAGARQTLESSSPPPRTSAPSHIQPVGISAVPGAEAKLAALDDDEDGAESESEGDEENAPPRFFISISVSVSTFIPFIPISFCTSIHVDHGYRYLQLRALTIWIHLLGRRAICASARRHCRRRGTARPGRRNVVVREGGGEECAAAMLEVLGARVQGARYRKSETKGTRARGHAPTPGNQSAMLPAASKTAQKLEPVRAEEARSSLESPLRVPVRMNIRKARGLGFIDKPMRSSTR
ncbi:hypothetical protein B0H13DRAFT_1881780 [Mycena leptocephala]|nr:hypothetical protein B0H13DRAFT_1881780 [Mycena leptocephala]